jgi:hypothetical protein
MASPSGMDLFALARDNGDRAPRWHRLKVEGLRATAATPPAQSGALAPENLKKPRPKAPFDLTGTWDGEWTSVHNWKRMDDTDITEVECLPNLNERLPATSSKGTSSNRFTA